MNRVEKLRTYMKTLGLSDYAIFNGIKDFASEAEDIATSINSDCVIWER